MDGVMSGATRGNTLRHAATRGNTLHRTATHCTALQQSQYRGIHCNAHCNTRTSMLGSRLFECTRVLQCVAVWLSMLQCVAVWTWVCCRVLQGANLLQCAAEPTFARVHTCVAVCCSVSQRDAVCCSVLRCVAVCCSVLQCVAEPFCLFIDYL